MELSHLLVECEPTSTVLSWHRSTRSGPFATAKRHWRGGQLRREGQWRHREASPKAAVGTVKCALKCLAKIAEEVKAIGDLNSLRCTCRRTTDVLRATVTRDNLDTGMLLEPGFKERRTALGQQVNGTPLLQVKQDSPIALAFTKGKIINAEDSWCTRWWLRYSPYQA
jgi:hypothetical protein